MDHDRYSHFLYFCFFTETNRKYFFRDVIGHLGYSAPPLTAVLCIGVNSLGKILFALRAQCRNTPQRRHVGLTKNEASTYYYNEIQTTRGKPAIKSVLSCDERSLRDAHWRKIPKLPEGGDWWKPLQLAREVKNRSSFYWLPIAKPTETRINSGIIKP